MVQASAEEIEANGNRTNAVPKAKAKRSFMDRSLRVLNYLAKWQLRA